MKPENEMLLAVLEPKTLKNGNVIYTGFFGFNALCANIHDGKIFLKIQKWPKKDKQEMAEENAPEF